MHILHQLGAVAARIVGSRLTYTELIAPNGLSSEVRGRVDGSVLMTSLGIEPEPDKALLRFFVRNSEMDPGNWTVR